MTEERRTIEKYTEIYAQVARSYRYVWCPFCDEKVKVYIWSFHGGGKRCGCGAMLVPYQAIKSIE